MEQLKKTCFVLVAGGLGERLGFNVFYHSFYFLFNSLYLIIFQDDDNFISHISLIYFYNV